MLQANSAIHTSPGTDTQQETAKLADVYTLLAQLMRYPEDTANVALLVQAQLELVLALDWHEEAEMLQYWHAQCQDLPSDLRIEYTRLFITAATCRSTVPPYASVHADSEALLQGRTTERIHDFYRSCGYELASVAEPADHIWLQLDFLAALVREGRHAEEEQFLASLFRPWFVTFKEKCFQATAHPVYRVTLILIDFFTKEEQ
ncbi:MAG: TorD/DmsD family molecular chaperone [Desulfobulbus sp.]|jgi:TorA maturation chaperone TorD